jgi:hypothetical protein
MNSTAHLPAADYEPRDASPRRLLLVGAGLAFGILLSLGIALALYFSRYHDAPRLGAAGRQTSFPHSSAAKTDIAADWQRQDKAVRQHLTTYGWIDREHGIVRIPIDRAMQRLVEDAPTRGDRAK